MVPEKKRSLGIFIGALLICLAAGRMGFTAGSARPPAANRPEQDLRLTWLTAASPHFTVLFPSHLEQCAGRIVLEAESIYGTLCSWTGYRPEKKIEIMVTDNSDFANGSMPPGSGGARVTIRTVYPYLNSADHDEWIDWYRSLLIHELAHFFHIDAAGGGPAFMRSIFGSVIYPNRFTPLLYAEGFAAYAETVLGSANGGGDSAFSSMQINAALEEGNFPTLDRVASRTRLWPGDRLPSLFGVSFLDYLSSCYGKDRMMEFNLQCGSYPMFLWGVPFSRLYGERMGVLWNKWQSSLEDGNHGPNEVSGNGRPHFLKTVSSFTGTIFSVAIDRSGRWIAYSGHPADRLGGLYLFDMQVGSTRCVKKGLDARELAFSRSGKKLFYIRHEIYRNVYVKKNVYVLDPARGKEKRLTDMGNVQGFLLLEDEKLLLVCLGTPSGTLIQLVDAATGNPRNRGLSMPAPSPVMEQPALSADGETVAFSYKNGQGRRGICIVPVQQLLSGAPSFQVVSDLSCDSYSPVWSGSGRILFVGNKNGGYGLYALDIRSGTTRHLSDAGSGVFDPELSDGGIVVLKEYSSRGYTVLAGRIPPAIYLLPAGQLPPVGLQPDYRKVATEAPDPGTMLLSEAQPEYRDAVPLMGVRPYRPAKRLLPGYWLPFMIEPNGNPGIGFVTGGRDPLIRHAYRIALLYDMRSGSIGSFFDYTFNTALLSYFFHFSASQDPRADVFAPAAAVHPGVSYLLRKRGFGLRTDLGIVAEDGYSGIDLAVTVDGLRGGDGWIGPESGCLFRHEVYIDFSEGSVLDDLLSLYFRPFGVSLLNLQLRGIAGIDREVVSGLSGNYVYLPLNGLYTRGFPDTVGGSYILDARVTAGLPLITVQRGIGAFPLFFRGMNAWVYSDNGFVFPGNAAAGDISQPRSSVGTELGWDFIMGYEFPLSFRLGYVHTVSDGGRDGVYAKVDAVLEF